MQWMNARELKHMARLTEWKEKVALLRSSGQPVRTRCRELTCGGTGLVGKISVRDTGSALTANLRVGSRKVEIYAEEMQ